MLLNPAAGAWLSIQHQVSSIQHRPPKSETLFFTPREEVTQFIWRLDLLYRYHRARRLQDDILRGGAEYQFADL